MKDDEKNIQSVGFDGYLRKPVQRKDLIREVMKHLPYGNAETEKDNTEKKYDAALFLEQDEDTKMNALRILKGSWLPEFYSVKSTYIISDIEKFAEKISIFGRQNSLEVLCDWAARTIKTTKRFDMDHLPEVLDSFIDLTKRIEKSMQYEEDFSN
jgi:hypothetical protein